VASARPVPLTWQHGGAPFLLLVLALGFVLLGRATQRQPEPADDLVEDKHNTLRTAESPHVLQIAGPGLDGSRIEHRGFHDHGRDLTAVLR